MTANQIAAMLFPVLVLVAYGVAAVIVTKVWGKKSTPAQASFAQTAHYRQSRIAAEHLAKADSLIQEAQRVLQRTP